MCKIFVKVYVIVIMIAKDCEHGYLLLSKLGRNFHDEHKRRRGQKFKLDKWILKRHRDDRDTCSWKESQ